MILLNTFKKGAFKLSIEHQLPIFPIIFYDCKRKFPWHTHFGYVGSLRVKALDLVDTNGMTEKDIDRLSLVLHKKIKDHLLYDTKKNSINAIELWRNRTPH
jgi:1-acyl-sn-glycerol-3-phosphate acyltransferase